MDFSTIDVIAFFGFIAFVIGVSLYKSGKKSTDEDYFLAGRKLTWWLIGISIIATNVSSEHFVGQAGQGFRDGVGLAIATWGWLAAIAMVIMAVYLLPLYLKIGIYTLPEFLEYRYHRAVRTLMSGYMLVFYAGISMATVLYGGALTLETIFDIPLGYGIWGIGIVAGCYTYYGGLSAVVWSDLIQGVALLLGAGFIFFLTLNEVGGWGEFVARQGDKLHVVMPLDHPELPWLAVFFGGMWIPHLFYWGFSQFIVQRSLAAESIEAGQKGVLLGATLKLTITFIIIIPGIMAFDLYGDEIMADCVVGNCGDAAYPTLIKKLLPVGLVGVMIAALFGAVLSTLDSLLNSAATIFTMDIYKPFINKNATPEQGLKVGKITTLVLVAISCLWAPIITTFEGGVYIFINQFWGFMQSGVVAAFFLGIFWKKVPWQAAIIGMVMNIPLYGFLLIAFPNLPFLHSQAITFGSIVLFIAVYTWIRPQKEIKELPVRYHQDYQLSPVVKYWGIALVATTIGLVLLFW
ncbi:MAG: sodium/solute symporter [Bacteroidota bacterium]